MMSGMWNSFFLNLDPNAFTRDSEMSGAFSMSCSISRRHWLMNSLPLVVLSHGKAEFDADVAGELGKVRGRGAVRLQHLRDFEKLGDGRDHGRQQPRPPVAMLTRPVLGGEGACREVGVPAIVEMMITGKEKFMWSFAKCLYDRSCM